MTSKVLIPKSGRLSMEDDHVSVDELTAGLENEIKKLVTQPNYPCVAALKSYFKDEYQVGIYQDFGSGQSWKDLRAHLGDFLTLQRQSKSPYLTFWAVFKDEKYRDEEQFEIDLWRELSHLSSVEDQASDWGSAATNPDEKSFCFHLFGEPFFVVGIHPESSRLSRRFKYPALLFNVFSQFRELDRQGLYHPMVKTNRARDEKFQGTPNPMSVAHGDDWETIQFSGKKNDTQWKCPFHFLFRSQKA